MSFRTAILVLLFGLLQFSASLACTCKEASLAQTIEGSDFVFRAMVNGAIATNSSVKSTRIRIFYTDLIPFKGGMPPFKELYTLDSGACGVEVLVPETYWIFATSDGFVSRCAFPRPTNSDEVRWLEAAATDQILRSVAKRRTAVPGVGLVYTAEAFELVIVLCFVVFMVGILLGRRMIKTKVSPGMRQLE